MNNLHYAKAIVGRDLAMRAPNPAAGPRSAGEVEVARTVSSCRFLPGHIEVQRDVYVDLKKPEQDYPHSTTFLVAQKTNHAEQVRQRRCVRKQISRRLACVRTALDFRVVVCLFRTDLSKRKVAAHAGQKHSI